MRTQRPHLVLAKTDRVQLASIHTEDSRNDLPKSRRVDPRGYRCLIHRGHPVVGKDRLEHHWSEEVRLTLQEQLPTLQRERLAAQSVSGLDVAKESVPEIILDIKWRWESHYSYHFVSRSSTAFATCLGTSGY
jgi:hypothetical protein